MALEDGLEPSTPGSSGPRSADWSYSSIFAACIIFSKLHSLNHHPIFKDQISRELKWPSCFHPRQPLLCSSVVRLNSLSTQATANGFLSNPLFQAKSKLHMCCHHAIYTTLTRLFCKPSSNFAFKLSESPQNVIFVIKNCKNHLLLGLESSSLPCHLASFCFFFSHSVNFLKLRFPWR